MSTLRLVEMEPLRLWRTITYAGVLSLVITATSYFLMFLSDFPTISPADINGCSLPRSYCFPLPFVFYKEPFIQNSCYGYVVSIGLEGLAIDLMVWLAIAFLFVVAVRWLRTK